MLNLSEIRKLSGGIFDTAEGDPVFRCRCGVEVTARLELCPKCAREDVETMREVVFGKALKSLPDMPHAVLGPSLRRSVDVRLMAGVQGWSASSGEGLALLGTSGAGKTTLAVALARHRLTVAKTAAEVKIASSIRFVSTLELQLERDRLQLGTGDDGPLMRGALKSALLILDEVGFEHEPRSGVAPVVFTLMQARYNSGRPTIVTSGLTEVELASRYGDATKRRMCERSRVLVAFGEIEHAPAQTSLAVAS